MKNLVLCSIAVLSLYAQPPDITGVWRANLAKSTVLGPAPSDYLIIITQQGSAYTLKTLIVRAPANTKNIARYDPSAAQTSNLIRGNPTRSHANWNGATLHIASSFQFGGVENTYQDDWTLAADGTLTNVHTQPPAPVSKVVFDRQPTEAASAFDQPEKTAKEAYKNVQVLNVPASSVLGIMNTYSLSLGVTCNHCHIAGQWEKDDMPAKATARKMAVMSRTINVDNFSPRVGVSCYTCHRGSVKPALIPPE